MNHEEIKKLIDTLPGVCKEGKEAVSKICQLLDKLPGVVCKEGEDIITDLVKELGYVPPIEQPMRKAKPGEVWRDKKGDAFYIIESNDKYRYFKWNTREQSISIFPSFYEQVEWFADNLHTAIAKGAK